MIDDNPIIKVNNVSKAYQRNLYRPSFRHDGMHMVKRLLRIENKGTWEDEKFWALKDINFTMQQGESVGIIGRNGAGKTTLLRLLSNVSAPTKGSITVKGRFVSLIGLGAGFDNERTGYENIYLNTAIYGLSIAQIEEIIPDIVTFSELEGFLNSPVKLYSSGMMARLGFSIAIHIFPDIIFLDEVLAVGDIAFQQKCFDRIQKFKSEHRTLIYVSHSPESVQNLCERTIWLNGGKIILDGSTNEVIDAYKEYLSTGALAPVYQRN